MSLHRKKSRYEREGYSANKAGELKVSNPHVNGTDRDSRWKARQWRLGWIAAEHIKLMA